MKALTATDPPAGRAADLVSAGLDADAVVTVFGRCEVDYTGRASSYLGPGDRLIVLKPDGTLLVHQREQHTPVNWQPPGCEHDAHVADGSLEVVSVREDPDERVEVRFETTHAVVSYEAEDVQELELSGSEADLRERILDDPDLVEEGFEPEAIERSTPVGDADIVGTDTEGRNVVLELKRRRVGPKAVSQLQRYVEALERESDGEARGILVAPSVTKGGQRLLREEGLDHVSLEPRSEA